MSSDSINYFDEPPLLCLELFSGTQSFGKQARLLGYDVVSVDITDYDGKYTPTHKVDIMNFDYTEYGPDTFSLIWCSPPCVAYSKCQYAWYGQTKADGTIFTRDTHEQNMLQSDIIIRKTLEIIDYFNPDFWFIENPQTGLLKSRAVMRDIPYIDVDYCQYSNWGYKKSTRIWTNKEILGKKCNKLTCPNMTNNKHNNLVRRTKNIFERYRIPPNLLNDLIV